MFDGVVAERSMRLVPIVADPLRPTVFHEAWLLDAASGGRHDCVEVLQDGVVVGRLPFVRRRSVGITLITQPRLTHLLGPAISEGDGAPTTRALRRSRIVRELLAKLPASSGFSQKIQGGLADIPAFQEAGYEIRVEITYELPPLPDAEMWRGMRDKTRNVIRRAQEQLEVDAIEDIPAFLAFYRSNLDDREQRSYYALGCMDAVCREAVARGRGQILGARDRDGRLLAAIVVLRDERVAYYFMSTRRKNAHNGAISLLLWTAIREASRQGLTFDFDGFSTMGSGLFYLGFGGRPAPRYVAVRSSLTFRIGKTTSEAIAWSRRAFGGGCRRLLRRRPDVPPPGAIAGSDAAGS